MQFHTSIPRRWLEACGQLNATPRLSFCIQRMGDSVSPRSGQDTWDTIKIFGLCQESNNPDLNIFVCRNSHQYKIYCLKAMEIFKDNILLENNLNLLLKSHYIRRFTFRNFDSCRLYGWQEIGLFVV